MGTVAFGYIIGDRITKDIRDVYTDSLQIAVTEWECPYRFDTSYGAGVKAYEYLINALQEQDINIRGAYYILPVYLNAKHEIYEYLKEVAKELPEIGNALVHYKKADSLYQEFKNLVFTGDFETDNKNLPVLIQGFMHLKEAEESGIGEIRRYLGETLINRRINPGRLRDL